ncbi:MAG TPA: fibronectin type III domain-containing protein [Methanocorpusculum sp.]|nr:fibronectin type III domain-containing protein [Methanocorpusculum sp.]
MYKNILQNKKKREQGRLSLFASMKILIFCFSILGVFLFSAQAQTVFAFYDFEDNTQYEDWHFVNGANGWYMGDASGVNSTIGGVYGLYVSSDSGENNAYTNAISDSWAYVDVFIPDGYAEFLLEFDWKCKGENSLDYMKVFIGRPDATPFGNSTPLNSQVLINELRTSNQIYFNGYDGADYDLSLGWNHYSNYFQEYLGDTVRLYFYWHNDNITNNDPPMTIDDIILSGIDCGHVHNMMSFPTSSGLTVSFSPALSTDFQWEYICVPKDSSIVNETPVPISDTFFTVTNLTDNTLYDVYIRTNCENEISGWAMQTFRTACSEFMILPYFEDFDSYTNSNYPQCWSLLTNYSTSVFPYITPTVSLSGNSSLMFESFSNQYSIAITPVINTMNNPMNSLSVFFRMLKKNATHGCCEIGVMTDPTNDSTFTPIDTILPEDFPVDRWIEFEFDLSNYMGTGNYIALYARRSTRNQFYIDDFSIYETPLCSKPLNVEASHITSNSAVIDWEAHDESEWTIAVVPVGMYPETANFIYAHRHPYVITNLDENTTYDVYVRAVCDTNVSVWSSVVTFTTLCSPLVGALPYIENFDSCEIDDHDVLPACWLKYTNGAVAYPYADDQYASSGTVSMRFYSDNNYYSYLISPAFDLSVYNVNSLLLTCKTLVTGNNFGRLNIGYLTDPDDLNTFALLKTIYPSDYDTTYKWYQWDILVPGNVTGPVYLIFMTPQGGYNSVYLDDFVLDYAPTCMAPSNLQISNITGASALISWDENLYETADYTVEYSKTGMNNWTSMSGITENHILLSGLSSVTSYEVRVFANCSSATNDTITGSFITKCLAGGEITIGDGIARKNTIPLSIASKYSYTQQIFDADEMDGSTIIKGIKFDYAGNNPLTMKNDVDIYLTHTTKSTFNNTTDWVSVNSATLVYSGSLNCSKGWNTFMFDTVFDYNGTDNLVLIVDDNSNQSDNFQYMFITHNILGKTILYKSSNNNPDPLTPPPGSMHNYRNNVVFITNCDTSVTCIPPNVMITSIDDQSVTLEWAPGNDESTWELEYKLISDSSWILADIVGNSPYVLANLTSGSDYEIRIRSVCSPEHSDWVTLNFTTECPPIEVLLYTENFDDASGPETDYFIDCWTRGANIIAEYPRLNNSQFVSSPNSLFLKGSATSYSYVATTRFDDIIRMDSLQLSFQMYKLSPAYYIEVGIMTDPNDYNTFVPISSVTPSTVSHWELAEVYTNHYTGTGHYIAFRIPKWITNSIYIDNVVVQYIPGCNNINNLTISNITANTARVTYSPGGDENTWEYLLGESGTVDLYNDIPTEITDTFILLENLNESTNYEIYVRGKCQNGEYSAWIFTGFRTICKVPTNLSSSVTSTTATLSWNEPGNFMVAYKKTSGNTWSNNITVNGNTTTLDNLLDGTDYKWKVRKICGVGIYSNWVNSTFTTACLPPTNLTSSTTTTTATLSWNEFGDFEVAYKKTSETNWSDNITVNGHTTTVNDLIPNTDYDWRIRQTCNDINSDWIVNTFTTSSEIVCETPTNLSTSVTPTTAILSWNETGNFEVTYKETSTTDWTTNTPVTGNTTTITNLTPNTNYDWQVRQICNDTIYSEWATDTFQTAEEPVCPTPENLTVLDITYNSATLTWEQEENTAIEWTLNYKPANINDWTISTITDNPYTITDLTANTDYEAEIRANCLNGINSDYTDILTFTTSVGIEDYTLPNNITLYPNPTSTYIDVKFNHNIRVSELNVYDVYGRLLQTIQTHENPTRINVSDLAAGVYFVRTFTNKGIANKPFIRK